MRDISFRCSFVTAFTAVLVLGSVCGFGQRAELDVHHVGEYAAIPWQEPGEPIAPGSRADRVRDLNFSIASVNVHDDMPESFYKGWDERIKLAARTGNILLPRIHFWDGKIEKDTPNGGNA